MIDIAQRAIERNSMIEIQIRETDEFIKESNKPKKLNPDKKGLVEFKNVGFSFKSIIC